MVTKSLCVISSGVAGVFSPRHAVGCRAGEGLSERPQGQQSTVLAVLGLVNHSGRIKLCWLYKVSTTKWVRKQREMSIRCEGGLVPINCSMDCCCGLWLTRKCNILNCLEIIKLCNHIRHGIGFSPSEVILHYYTEIV